MDHIQNTPPGPPSERGGERDASRLPERIRVVTAGAVLIGGLCFLSRHDTESGHIPLLISLALVIPASLSPQFEWNRRRIAFAMVAMWALPVLSLLLANRVHRGAAPAWQVALVERCRFTATPVDDI